MRIRAAIAATAVAGLALAAYLTVVHYAHVAPACTSGGCETVQGSSYAELAGVPVAVLGLVAYAAIVATALVRGIASALAGATVALGAAAFGGYLLWAQLGPIGAVCAWCVGSDVLVALLTVLCAARLLRE